MSIDKLREAGELIKVRKFPQARAILVDLDHPKAREWLGKIDAMYASEDPFAPMPRPMSTRESPRRRRIPVLFVLLAFAVLLAIGAIGVISIARQSFANNALLGTAIDQQLTAYLNATATGALPPVPLKLPKADMDKVIYKCLSKVYDNKGMYADFQNYLYKNIIADDMNSIGSLVHIYMEDACDTTEAFQVSWFSYLDVKERATKPVMDKSIAWSIFLVGWRDIDRMHAEQTATKSAYKSSLPTEVEATPVMH